MGMRRSALLLAPAALALLLSCTLVLVGLQETAKAASPGTNGKIAFQKAGYNSQIHTMNNDGSNSVALTTFEDYDLGPKWSPDGKRIAFYRDNSGGFYGGGHIYVMNADGSNLTNLTGNGGFDKDPAWSPDGKKIAFSSSGEIYVMNADGSNRVRLTTATGWDMHPTWSPDGTKIAFSSERNGGWSEIYVMNANGSSQTRLTTNSVHDDWPDWSPDGTKIAFSKGFGTYSSGQIVTMNPDGTGAVRLTTNGNEDYAPAWSPDGTKIVFTRDYSELFVMDSDGSDELRLSSGTYPHEARPDWQPAPSDSVLPTVTLTEPAEGTLVGGDVTISAEATDEVSVAHVRFFVNGKLVGTDTDAPYSVTWDARNSSNDFADGSATVTARAADTSYNFATSPGRMVTVDSTAPSAVIDAGPPGLTNQTSASFRFSSEEGATFQCSLDDSYDGAFSMCSSPQSQFYDDVTEGSHAFWVRAVDTFGNVQRSATSYRWTVDTTNPDAVSQLTTTPADRQVSLAWNNPTDEDFETVRLLRSTVGYADSPTQTTGQTRVYEGPSAEYTDTGLTTGTNYYYTAFARDKAGNWSSRITTTAKPIPAKPTTLTLSSSESLVQFNGEAVLNGKLSTSAGLVSEVKSVTVQRSTDGGGTWQNDGTATYDSASKSYKATRSLTANATFRLRYGGDPFHTAATSPGVLVKAKAYLTQPVTPDTVRKNTAFPTYGFLEPLHSGSTPLYFYHYEGGRYKLYERPAAKNAAYDKTTTKYTLQYKLPYAGKWMVKARHSDASHAPTWSPVREFVVSR